MTAVASEVKLVIWDLDDTLWRGTLAEDREVTPDAGFVALIGALLDRGIVHAIASKNDPDAARARLEALGLWDLFVFPRIALVNKGAPVAEILAAMGLRAANALLVDDNPFNLREVASANPGILTMSPEALRALDVSAWGAPDPGRARLASYRLLEARHKARRGAEDRGASEAQFLRESRIEVEAVPLRPGDAARVVRVVELVNRANQLNFTGSRFHNEHHFLTGALRQGENWAFHVRDRYGDYGLCGYASVRAGSLRHFVFSCRTLGMHAEAAALQWLEARHPGLRCRFDRARRNKLESEPVDYIPVSRKDPEVPALRPADAPRLLLKGSCFMRAVAGPLAARCEVSEEVTLGGKASGVFELRRHFEDPARRNPPALMAHTARSFDQGTRAFDAIVYYTEFDVFGALFRRRGQRAPFFSYYALDREDWLRFGESPLFHSYFEALVSSLDEDTDEGGQDPLEGALHFLARHLPAGLKRRVFARLLLKWQPRASGEFEGLLDPEEYFTLLDWYAGRVHPETTVVFILLPEDADLPVFDAARNARIRGRIAACNAVLRRLADQRPNVRLLDTTGLLTTDDIQDGYGHLRKSGYHKVQMGLERILTEPSAARA